MNIYQDIQPLNIPYTYRLIWTDSVTGIPKMHYYGVRYAKNCHPNDLWVSYFTSSRYVTDYVKRFGNPTVIEIRKVFNTTDRIQKAIDWEKKVLVKLKAHLRDDYINKHAGSAINYSDPDVIARIEYVNSLDATKQNRKRAAIEREQCPEKRKKRLERSTSPEAIEKRRKSYIETTSTDEYHQKRSQLSKEINARPDILEANKQRFLGVTWEERIGEEAAREYKSNMSLLRKSNAWDPTKGIKKGKDSPNADKTVYTWENTGTTERVQLTGIEFSKKYNLDNAGVRKIIKNFGQLSSKGKPFSIKGWVILSK